MDLNRSKGIPRKNVATHADYRMLFTMQRNIVQSGFAWSWGGVGLDCQVVTIAKGIEVLEHEDQRVLINPSNREWIKLADYAYELVSNPQGKPVRQLVAEESLHSGIDPKDIESLFQYLEKYGFLAEVSDVVTLTRAYLNITARCNLVCPMCYFASNESSQKEELQLEDVYLIIDTLDKAGLGNLVISGGEPLLCHDFLKY